MAIDRERGVGAFMEKFARTNRERQIADERERMARMREEEVSAARRAAASEKKPESKRGPEPKREEAPASQRGLNAPQAILPPVSATTVRSGAGAGGSTGREFGSNAVIMQQALVELGVKPEVAAGAVGSMMGESGRHLNPSAYNPDDFGKPSGGALQWRGDRLAGLYNFAGTTDIRKIPIEVQAKYMQRELQTSEKGALQNLLRANTVADGTRVWTYQFERPRDKAGDTAKRTPMGEQFWQWSQRHQGDTAGGTTPRNYSETRVAAATTNTMSDASGDIRNPSNIAESVTARGGATPSQSGGSVSGLPRVTPVPQVGTPPGPTWNANQPLPQRPAEPARQPTWLEQQGIGAGARPPEPGFPRVGNAPQVATPAGPGWVDPNARGPLPAMAQTNPQQGLPSSASPVAPGAAVPTMAQSGTPPLANPPVAATPAATTPDATTATPQTGQTGEMVGPPMPTAEEELRSRQMGAAREYAQANPGPEQRQLPDMYIGTGNPAKDTSKGVVANQGDDPIGGFFKSITSVFDGPTIRDQYGREWDSLQGWVDPATQKPVQTNSQSSEPSKLRDEYGREWSSIDGWVDPAKHAAQSQQAEKSIIDAMPKPEDKKDGGIFGGEFDIFSQLANLFG